MDEQKQPGSAQNTNRWSLVAVIALVVVVLAVRTAWKGDSPTTETAQKLIWVQVLHGDGSIRDFDLNTDQETLGPALVEGGVVEDNQDGCGLSIRTADGETADGSRQEWWRITKNGELVSTGADAVLIADGDRFELAFQVGYGRS